MTLNAYHQNLMCALIHSDFCASFYRCHSAKTAAPAARTRTANPVSPLVWERLVQNVLAADNLAIVVSTVPGADGPPWMMACLRSVDRGKTFELINTDSTLGLGRDKEATEHAGFTFMSDAAVRMIMTYIAFAKCLLPINDEESQGRGAISAMAWTTEGELIATGVSNWDITSAWSYDDGNRQHYDNCPSQRATH